jgi:hypothetical protein
MIRVTLGFGLILLAACGAKDHPPALGDTVEEPHHDGGGVVVVHPVGDAGKDGSSAATDAGTGGALDQLSMDIKNNCKEKPPYTAYMCYQTEKGHPGDPLGEGYSLNLQNGVHFEWKIDDPDRQFDAVSSYNGKGGWLKVIAPMGQTLKPGSYSTATSDAAISFIWANTNGCPGVETGTFNIISLEWDNTNTVTKAEIDFRQHCGPIDSTPALGGIFRLNSSLPP